ADDKGVHAGGGGGDHRLDRGGGVIGHEVSVRAGGLPVGGEQQVMRVGVVQRQEICERVAHRGGGGRAGVRRGGVEHVLDGGGGTRPHGHVGGHRRAAAAVDSEQH